MRHLTIWCVDVSTAQAQGSDWIPPGTPIPPDFQYEPWESVLDMLSRWFDETPYCDGFYSFIGSFRNPEVIVLEPCLMANNLLPVLEKHGPAGWYEFDQMVEGALYLAQMHQAQFDSTTIYVVNRGPLMRHEERRVADFIEMALNRGITINTVPMGNEPNRPFKFPNLYYMQQLAHGTGGKVYYAPNLSDPHDFSMLPAFVPQMLDDLD